MSAERVPIKGHAIAGTIIAVLLSAVTVGVSSLLGDSHLYIASVLIACYSCIPFFMSFEGRRPAARELVTIAVLSAIAVVSRVAFIALPSVKPIIGIIFIAGMGMGPGGGFMVGSLSAIASNLVFGQGPWTPWQMLAYGIAGFIAGLLSEKGLIKAENPVPAALCGAFVALVFVGVILDTCALFLTMSVQTVPSVLAIYLSGLPVNAVLAVATFVTILLLARPLLEKLERVKTKYGMLE